MIEDFRKKGVFSQIGQQLNQLKKDIREIKSRMLTTPLNAPSYTTADRNALLGVGNGRIIYNTDTNKLQVYANGLWVDLH